MEISSIRVKHSVSAVKPDEERIFSLFLEEKLRSKAVPDLTAALRKKLSKKKAIIIRKCNCWPIEGNNTTKQEQSPVDLGLFLLREFISKDHGRLQIASG